VTKGGFWTANTGFEPKAQFRFKVKVDGFRFEDAPGTTGDSNQGDFANDRRADTDVAWYAKSVDKPGFEILSNVPEGDYFNLGSQNALIDINLEQPKLKKVSMTLVDPSYPNVTRKLLRWIRRTGYNDKKITNQLCDRNISRQQALLNTIGHVRIYQLDSFKPGESLELEEWILYNAYPSRIDFGKLDYSSGELVEIQIDWVYSNFVCRMAKFPRDGTDIEQEFPYFEDFRLFGGSDGASESITKRLAAIPPEDPNTPEDPSQVDQEQLESENPFQ
jgi:hypothetical protein